MKSLFPEVEVTKSLSSNLLKRGLANVMQDEVRVIEVNARMAQRIEALGIKVQPLESEGFRAGISAADADDGTGSDGDVFSGESGNVLKASAPAIMEQQESLAQETERILEEARKQAELILEDAKRQAEEESLRVLEEARTQGYQEGQESARKEAENLEREFAAKKVELEEEYQRLVEELEPQFIDTITGIYEHIFHVQLHSYREILIYLISATLRKADGNRTFCIHISKEDYPYVSMQKKQIAAGTVAPGSTIDIVEDNTLSQNECLIETENGIFDCGLGTQLSELKQQLVLLSYER